MPRAADGVGTACESLSTFVVGEVKHAKSPQTVTEISMIFHHLHVLLSAKSAERIALYLYLFNSRQVCASHVYLQAFLAVDVDIYHFPAIVNGKSDL